MYSQNKIPGEIVRVLDNFISDKHTATRSTGGCINETAIVESAKGKYFLKWNNAAKYPAMLATEVIGLKRLAETQTARVPNVVANGETDVYQYLLLECITSKPRSNDFSKILGQQLAALHSCSDGMFGFDHDNYIGSLPQSNRQHKKWIDFFIHERLQPQIQLAARKSLLNANAVNDFEKLFAKLPELLPERSSSLLHGDLWSGNVITDELGHPCLIDPSVYFGDNEVDLAMTQLFGGFDPSFLDAYHEVVKLESGWRERFDIHNLYPLLVHVNLFGQTYVSQLLSSLRRFV